VYLETNPKPCQQVCRGREVWLGVSRLLPIVGDDSIGFSNQLRKQSKALIANRAPRQLVAKKSISVAFPRSFLRSLMAIYPIFLA
jgi:hypothetical protein